METYTPNNLIAGNDFPAIQKAITLLAGLVYLVGTVLGAITRELGAVVAGGGNAGDGVVNGIAMGKATQLGNYVLTCIEAVADGGVFSVVAPDGTRLADAVVGVAYANDQIAFTINDGAADFIVGDTFTIPVTEPAEMKFTIVDKTAVDGSADPKHILSVDVDASEADAAGPQTCSGVFIQLRQRLAEHVDAAL